MSNFTKNKKHSNELFQSIQFDDSDQWESSEIFTDSARTNENLKKFAPESDSA